MRSLKLLLIVLASYRTKHISYI